MNKPPRRGEIYLVDLHPVRGSEISGARPCIIVQNDTGNECSPTTVIVPCTSKIPPKRYPFVVVLKPEDSGLPNVSVAKCDQIRTISIKDRMQKRAGKLSTEALLKVERALMYELGIKLKEHKCAR